MTVGLQYKVRKVDSSSSILLSKDCLATRGLLCFYANCEILCSQFSSVAQS